MINAGGMLEKILEHQARLNPARPSIWTDKGEISYGLFARHISQATTALAQENLPPGVVLIGKVSASLHWVLTLALERLGHPTACEPVHLEAAANIIKPAVVIAGDPNWTAQAGERYVQVSQAWRRNAFQLPPSPRRSPAHPDDLVRIVLSSGTTGDRKQVPIKRSVMDARLGRPLLGARTELRFLQTMGLDTIGNYHQTLATWLHGGLMLNPKRITAQTLSERKPTFVMTSPAHLRDLLPLIAAAFSETNRVHIRVAGSAMPPALIRDALACPGLDLSISYGSTEGGTIAAGPASLAIRRPGAVGFPTPWADVEVVDDDGAPAPKGQSGVIRIRALGSVGGYIGKTQGGGGFQDGWFYPNDVGRIDDDGVLIIDGRRDDVINLGGQKLSASRVEETVIGCAGVSDAAVVAFPMASGKWRLFAAIVSTSGYDPDEIREAIRKAHDVAPTLIDLPQIARNPMGKIQRAEVRAAVLLKNGVVSG